MAICFGGFIFHTSNFILCYLKEGSLHVVLQMLFIFLIGFTLVGSQAVD